MAAYANGSAADLVVALFVIAVHAAVAFVVCLALAFVFVHVRDRLRERRAARRRPGPLPPMTFQQIVSEAWPNPPRWPEREEADRG